MIESQFLTHRPLFGKMAQMTEAKPVDSTPVVEPRPGSPEILDLDSYGGLYGRLLVATQFPPKGQESILNPETPVDINLIPIITPGEGRDYSPITWNLSATERVNAWGGKPLRGKDFDDAYKDWRRKFTNAINADQKRKEAFAIISGRGADQFSEDDTDVLYGRLCSGKSDTTQFSRTSADNLHLRGVDGKIDPEKLQKLQKLKDEIEKIASWLFGKQTAPLVARMVEIEASITSEGQAAIDAIISKPERLNELTEKEKEILAPVYKGIVEGPPPGFEVVPVAPLATLEEEEEDEDKLGTAAQPATPKPTDTATATTPQTRPELEDRLESGEKITPLTEKEKDPKKRQLRSILGTRNAEGYVPISRPSEDLPRYVASLLGKRFKGSGEVKFIENGNTAIIRNVEVANAIPRFPSVRFDIKVSNNRTETGELTAEILGGEPRFAKGQVGEDLKGLTGLVKKEYDQLVEGLDRKVGGVLIRKGKLVVGFIPKTSVVTAAEPSN